MLENTFHPGKYGVDLERTEFVNQVVEDFNSTFGGIWMVDEVLVHPRQAERFCERVRRKHEYSQIPDDFILRSVVQRSRKLW